MSWFWWTGQQFSMACHLFAASASTASFWFVVKIFWSNPEVWHVLAIFADMNKGDWFFGGDRKYFRGFSDWNLRRDELLGLFCGGIAGHGCYWHVGWGSTVTNLLVTLHWGSKRAYIHFWSFFFGEGNSEHDDYHNMFIMTESPVARCPIITVKRGTTTLQTILGYGMLLCSVLSCFNDF